MRKRNIPLLVRSVVYGAALLATITSAAASGATARVFGYTTAGAGMDGTTNVAAACGSDHLTAVLKTDGNIQVWANNNDYGVMNVPSGLNPKAIACGTDFMLALNRNGTVRAWGYNGQGQTEVPAGLNNVKAISAAENTSLALKTDGTVVAWGSWGNPRIQPPAHVNEIGAVAISTSNSNCAAILSNGETVTWGANIPAPTPAEAFNLKAIDAGPNYFLGLKQDGTLVLWGSNAFDVPSVPSDLSGVVSIAATGSVALALKEDGTVTAFGFPSYVSGIDVLTNVSAIYAGGSCAVALVGNDPTPFPGTFSTSVSSLVGGSKAGGVGSIVLNAPATSATTIALSSSDPSISVPATVTIPKNKTSVNFKFTSSIVNSDTTVTLAAAIGFAEQTVDIAVHPLLITDVTLKPTVPSGSMLTGSLSLQFPVSVNTQVQLSSTSDKIYVNPITVLAGRQTVNFNLLSRSVAAPEAVDLIFTLGSSTVTRTVTVDSAPLVQSILVGNSYANRTITATVKLSKRAPAQGVMVHLTPINDDVIGFYDNYLLIPAGKISMPFPIKLFDIDTQHDWTIKAFNEGLADHMELAVSKTITVRPVQLATAAPNVKTIIGGGIVAVTITLNQAAGNSSAAVNIWDVQGPVLWTTDSSVGAGQITKTIYVATDVVSKPTKASLTFEYHGVIRTIKFTVVP